MEKNQVRGSIISRIIGVLKKTDGFSESREQIALKALAGKFSKIQYLMEQRALFDVIEKTPVGICITNKQYIYEYVNPAYCRIYGYDYQELIGEPFTKVVPEEHRAYLMELHDRFMDQEYELEGEWEVIRKDGRRLSILANAAYVVDEQFNPKKITFVLDRTDEIGARTSMDQLLEKISTARDVAASLIHESDEGKRAVIAKNLMSIFDSLSQRKGEGDH